MSNTVLLLVEIIRLEFFLPIMFLIFFIASDTCVFLPGNAYNSRVGFHSLPFLSCFPFIFHFFLCIPGNHIMYVFYINDLTFTVLILFLVFLVGHPSLSLSCFFHISLFSSCDFQPRKSLLPATEMPTCFAKSLFPVANHFQIYDLFLSPFCLNWNFFISFPPDPPTWCWWVYSLSGLLFCPDLYPFMCWSTLLCIRKTFGKVKIILCYVI